jgi:hypothetical protein
MTVEGLLTKSVNYYSIGNYNEMRVALMNKGREIMEKLTIRTNSSLSTPVLDSLKGIGMVRVFFTTALSTIIFFLSLLSI